ncbi:uncharacterized protein PG998_005602 [Apiospora kogelbergensis]|uniref:uncharacterized protein n=1 Tax=Apiospora kogelbergensis TaxID=1337665 RepID=UPI00312ED960
MVTVDPMIAALFGPPPAGMDLTEENYSIYNGVACAFFSLAVVAVMLRVYVRITRGASLAIDDHTIVGAIFCAAGTLFMTLYAAKLGSGQHIWAANTPDLITLLKCVYAEPYVYAVSVTTTRVSILLLYHRLFDTNTTSNTLYVWQTRFAVGLTGVYPIIMFIVMAAACRPVSFYWTQYLGESGTCIDVTLFYLAFGIVNMVNDVVILILPIPTIAKLQLSWRKRISIMAIMLLGCFSCVSSIIRIFYLNKLAHEADVAWWLGPGFGWSCIEPSVAIITACLPTLAPLFRKSQPSSQAYNYYRSCSDPRQDRSHPHRGDISAERGEQWTKMEEDEIELTRNNRRESYSPSGKTDSHLRHDGVITVSTQVDVSSSSQKGGQSWNGKSGW